ncbi:hypothetical protein V6N12_071977 [Hibiscus sabdariffa]|uniref:Rit1 DUSP-like domain-containing protein n=1 Tax=Hibiscus sabdariffa TaxID=183260 RepID=A0ABR2FLI7_9ROSI
MAISVPHQDAEAYLHLPIVNSKMDRFSLLNNLSSATTFAKSNLTKGRTLLICCRDGEDISVCVCLAILISLFDDEASQSSASHPMLGSFDGGESFSETATTSLNPSADRRICGCDGTRTYEPMLEFHVATTYW